MRKIKKRPPKSWQIYTLAAYLEKRPLKAFSAIIADWRHYGKIES